MEIIETYSEPNNSKYWVKLHKITNIEELNGVPNNFGTPYDLRYRVYVNDGSSKYDDMIELKGNVIMNNDKIEWNKLFKIVKFLNACGYYEITIGKNGNKFVLPQIEKCVGKEIYIITYASGHRKPYEKDGVRITPIRYRKWDTFDRFNDKNNLVKSFLHAIERNDKFSPKYTPEIEVIREEISKDEPDEPPF